MPPTTTPPSTPPKQPSQAAGVAAPSGADVKHPVEVQFYVARLKALHVASTGGAYSAVDALFPVSGAAPIDLTFAVPDAVLSLEMLLADKDFVPVMRTVGTGKSARSVETLAQLSGSVTLAIEPGGHFGFVERTQTTQGKKKVIQESAPQSQITATLVSGRVAPGAGSPAHGVIAVKRTASPPASGVGGTAPPPAKITITFGEVKDAKGNVIDAAQLAAEHASKGAPVTWPVQASEKMHPEWAHQRWPSDDSTASLIDEFEHNVTSFFDALKAVQVNGQPLVTNVRYNSVYRSPQHAYLFCYARRVMDGKIAPGSVPAFKDLDGQPDPTFPEIDWRAARSYGQSHFGGNPTANYDPPSSTTNHLRRLAIDCSIDVNITARVEATVNLPEFFYKFTRSTAADGKVTFTPTKQTNAKRTETLILELNDGENGWVAVGDSEYKVYRSGGTSTSDVKTYSAGRRLRSRDPAKPTFKVDVSGVTMSEEDKAKVKSDVEAEINGRHEEKIKTELETESAKAIAKRQKAGVTLTDEQKAQIRKDTEAALRAKHEKLAAAEIAKEVPKRQTAELARRKQEEHDRQYAASAPGAEQQAKTQAEDLRKQEGNFWKPLHRLGEKYFGVVHFTNVLKDLPHWSWNGG